MGEQPILPALLTREPILSSTLSPDLVLVA